ncbi:hypothetical protein Gohar_016059 [Gossypium harknessii]|uniref:CREG-like beta-barrel domain-containing protein n=1 Tax=Gossypium harknessii TaxID=34285 RepID=A0A7J9G1Q1_9ROSI|nr:hypothetical protein [Gossypium harknessii]
MYSYLPVCHRSQLYSRFPVFCNKHTVFESTCMNMSRAFNICCRNVVSFSDGVPGKGTGVPYFYLTTLDPTARNALKDHRSSLAISEYPLGTCSNADPESPMCAKITLTGRLVLLEANSKEAEFARTALFTKHPEMKGWPKGHDFQVFKLEIEDIFMINWFGGPKPLTVDQYLKYKM